MLYRICTEDINRPGIERIVSSRFPGFTTLTAHGFWKLQKENSLIIEVVTDVKNEHKIKAIAGDIKALNNQESVLIQRFNSKQYFV